MGRHVVEIAPGVLVATSRRYATTSTLILQAATTSAAPFAEAVVVDPAWDADELAGLAEVLRERKVMATAGLATHVHYDHVLWHPNLPDVPRWSTAWSAERWTTHRNQLITPLVGDIPDELCEYVGRLTALPSDTALPSEIRLPWTPREVLLHEHDAHAPHHLAAEIVDVGVLVAGDMLSDVELPMPGDDEVDLTTYLAGLDRLAPVVARCRVLIPGHGTPTGDPMARLDADRRYLDDLLAGRNSDDPRRGLPDMVELHEANVQRARATRRGNP